MVAFKNRENITYGRLLALEPKYKVKPNGQKVIFWLCKCDCGSTCEVRGDMLSKGKTKSCGCLHREAAKQSLAINTLKKFSFPEHERNHPIMRRWQSMNARCQLNQGISAKYYKNRGITVCNEWQHDYYAFKEWALNNGFQKHLQIDRINNDLGYSPDNCRFVTAKENMNNRRNSKKQNPA